MSLTGELTLAHALADPTLAAEFTAARMCESCQRLYEAMRVASR